MKRSTSEIMRRRKLVLRREAIAILAPPQLGTVAGGVGPAGSFECSGTDTPCGTSDSNAR